MTIDGAARTIRVLVLEDRPNDAELMIRQLRAAGFAPDWTRVDDEESFAAALHAGLDVILADFALPRFNALDAVRLVRERGLHVPFIIVSASLGDERAADCIREGVDDYLLKDRLARLAPAVSRVLERERLKRERRDADERRRAMELRLQVATDACNVGVWDLDLSTRRVYLSPEWMRQLGYGGGELPTRFDEWHRLLHPADREHVMAAFAACQAGGAARYDVEFRLRHKDGSYRWIHSRATIVADDAGRPLRMLGCYVDITERKAVESALRESAERLKALMDHANDGIAVLTPAGVILDANLRMADMLGTTPDAMLGKHITEFGTDDQAAMQAFSAELNAGRGRLLGAPLQRADGAVISVDFSLARVTIGGESLVLSIGRDMTEQRSLEQQFLQAQKMEAVGRLAGGVAHDFNNILTTIVGYAGLLRSDHALTPAALDDLQQVEKAAQRAAAMTKQLLAFSRQQVLQVAVVEPDELVADLEKMLHRLIGEDVQLVLRLSAGGNRIQVDQGQLNQVILNLVVNARDAMPTGGHLDIETSRVTLASEVAGVRAAVRPGEYVAIRVRDTGTGMDDETMLRIFEPFFTTKERGKGTGLGLSTVFGIVEQSNGYVGVESEAGRGTTFTIYFPVTTKDVDLRPNEPASPVSASGTILLTEDDEQLRPLERAMLERMGYRVLDAADGKEALRIAAKHIGRIDLLIADVVMPGLSGPELAVQVRRLHPETRVLYISGYTGDAIVHHGVDEQDIALLQKPFTAAELARKARQVLAAAFA
jgi:PAS domain S-box-containing protein